MNMNKFLKPWKENNIVSATTTKLIGPFFKYQVPRNFREILKLQKMHIVTAQQIHKNRIAIITRVDSGNTINKVDGLITKDENVCLVIFTADCIPIFFYDRVKKVIGLTHAGRRGSLMNISESTVKEMQKLGAQTQYIKVHLGPHICKKCYQLDLAKINIIQLMQNNILQKNITVSEFCTYEDRDIFYSYRREKPTTASFNEMLSFIALK